MSTDNSNAVPIKAPKERWNLGILSAFILVCVWGVVFLGLIDSKQLNIENIEFLVDPERSLNVTPIVQKSDDNWQSIGDDNSLGMSSAAHWFRFELPAEVRDLSDSEQLLEVDYPMLDSLEIWLIEKRDDQIFVHDYYQLGDTQHFAAREIQHALFLVPLKNTERVTHVYARVETSGTVRFPVSIWQPNDYLTYSATHASIMAIFFGFMVAMAISNLFFFITTRSMTFLVYTGYVLSLGITIATLHGYAFQYLWPNNIYLQGRAIAIFASFTLCFAVIFSYQTLEVKRYSRKVDHYLKFLAVLFFLFSLVSMAAPYTVMIKLFMFILLTAVVSILACGIWLSARGSQVARYYTLAWAFLLLSGFSATLDNLDIVALPVSSHYILIFGASVETLLLGLILAMRYSQQRDSLSAAQALALEQEQAVTRAKDELIQVQQQSQDELEYNVQERTLELEIALRELSEANRELEQISAMDQLTSLPNRRHFDKRFLAESRRSRREQTPLTIGMMDIDHFKQVNDQFGHISGDQCLQVVADKLKALLKRPGDEVCRYGGEEFAIILPNTDVLGGAQVLEEMREAIESMTIETDDHSFNVTLSAGVTSATIAWEGQERDLLEFADNLLYQAKKNGRNQVINRAFNTKQQDLQA